MKKTIVICITIFITIISSILIYSYLDILKIEKQNNNEILKQKRLENTIEKYDKCAEKSKLIELDNLSGKTLVEGKVTGYQIPAYKVEDLKELQSCLEKVK